MTPLLWSPQALSDLEAIRAYVAQDSSRYADLVVQRIIAGVERLARFPESGRVVPERGEPSVREVIVGAYRVVTGTVRTPWRSPLCSVALDYFRRISEAAQHPNGADSPAVSCHPVAAARGSFGA